MNKILPFGLLLVVLLTGCKFFGADPAPPSAFERRFFDVVTNTVERVVIKTNHVDVPITVYVLKTNELNQISQLTNTVIIRQVELSLVTNHVEVYDWSPNATATTGASVAGTGANFVAPGSGGLITGAILTGLAAWGKLRSRKKTGDVLGQNIEAIREFVKVLPNGTDYDRAITNFLRKDQEDKGVRKQVKVITKNEVDESDAKSSASEIRSNLVTVSAIETAKPVV